MTTPSKDQCCDSCIYSVSHKNIEAVVICRRYPPAWKSGCTSNEDQWPTVQKGQWCGEWR